jgi:hypothetical protein
MSFSSNLKKKLMDFVRWLYWGREQSMLEFQQEVRKRKREAVAIARGYNR